MKIFIQKTCPNFNPAIRVLEWVDKEYFVKSLFACDRCNNITLILHNKQDQVETANSRGFRALGRSWQLGCSAEHVSGHGSGSRLPLDHRGSTAANSTAAFPFITGELV